MAYSYDMAGSARRHLKAADHLHAQLQPGDKPGCQAVSGYLYGLAGELALKTMMAHSGMKEDPQDKRNDPYFAHFPTLRTMLKDTASGRLQGRLLHISGSNMFDNWSTDMRYAPTKEIKAAWVNKWKNEAKSLVEEMSDL